MSPTFDPPATAIEQAIEWHQRLDQGEMDAASRRELSAWMQSSANAEELARICLIDALLQHGSFKSEPRPALPENVIAFHTRVQVRR